MIISYLLSLCLLGVALYGLRIFLKGALVLGPSVILLSLGGVFFAFFPDYTTLLANAVGVGRGADLLLYLLFVLVVALILLLHAKLERQNLLITELARAVALAHAKTPPKA